MASQLDSSGRLPAAYMTPETSSFVDFLSAQAPELLPGHSRVPSGTNPEDVSHGTTIVAINYSNGVVMAADRRATMGNLIAQRDIEKVFPADEFSCIGCAGAAGIAEELVRIFQMELEHYEKIAGHTLSLEGKANRLASMIRGILGLAMEGLAVLPVFAGYDHEQERGRIFSYEVTGGRYEEHEFFAVGSGSVFARGSLKKLYRSGFAEQGAATAAIQALYDAADDDSATGGPDLARGIFPMVSTVTADGYRRLSDDEVGPLVRSVVDGRMEQPDGPTAPLE